MASFSLNILGQRAVWSLLQALSSVTAGQSSRRSYPDGWLGLYSHTTLSAKACRHFGTLADPGWVGVCRPRLGIARSLWAQPGPLAPAVSQGCDRGIGWSYGPSRLDWGGSTLPPIHVAAGRVQFPVGRLVTDLFPVACLDGRSRRGSRIHGVSPGEHEQDRSHSLP